MKITAITTVLFFFFLLSYGQSEDSWKLQKVNDSIFVYTQYTATSKYKSIRIYTTFRCSMAKMTQMMKDVNMHYTWLSHCKESTLLKSVGDSVITYYEYLTFPWPASDRDVVVEAKFFYDQSKNTVRITQESIKNYLPEKKNIVRVPEYRGSWMFTVLPDGRTAGEYIASVEPGGSVPVWFINLFATYGPYETIKNLKELAESNTP